VLLALASGTSDVPAGTEDGAELTTTETCSVAFVEASKVDADGRAAGAWGNGRAGRAGKGGTGLDGFKPADGATSCSANTLPWVGKGRALGGAGSGGLAPGAVGAFIGE